MLKLILKYLLIIVIVALWYLFIVYEDMRHDVLGNNSNYLAAIIDKTDALKKAPPGKILLLGGSNLAFGVDSDQIQLSTKKNIVNMGLHGGTGLNFFFKLSEKYIYKGDIVLCSPEYIYFTSDKFYGDSSLIDTVYYVPEYGSLLLDVPQVYSIIEKNIYRNNNIRKRGLKHLFDAPLFVKDIYYREGFNKYGDVVSYLNKPSKKLKKMNSLSGYDRSFINKLIEFKRLVESKGAIFIFAYPCFPESQYNADSKIITSIHNSLVAANVARFISPKDFVFDENCFFDTSYHLNATCREKRTQLLIDLINNYSIAVTDHEH